MKSKTLLYTTLILLVIINMFLIIKLLNLKKEIKELPGLFQQTRIQKNLMEEGFFQYIDFANIEIDYNEPIYDLNEQKSTLYDVLKDTNTLILFIYTGSCSPCIVKNINVIKKIRKENDLNIKILITGLQDFRGFKSYIKTYGIEDYAFMLEDGFDGFNVNPIVYCLNTRQMESKFYFAPNENLLYLTENYLIRIKEYFNLVN